jgi:hypothetical protein
VTGEISQKFPYLLLTLKQELQNSDTPRMGVWRGSLAILLFCVRVVQALGGPAAFASESGSSLSAPEPKAAFWSVLLEGKPLDMKLLATINSSHIREQFREVDEALGPNPVLPEVAANTWGTTEKTLKAWGVDLARASGH